jgi:hypothetical protein
MRAATLIAPVIAAERRLVAVERRIVGAPSRGLDVDFDDLARSIEVSEEEILDDLLYPSDHTAARR